MIDQLSIAPLEDWGLPMHNGKMLLAGPCSAETPAQVMATARQIAPMGPSAFRAGIWKPRTRPGHFEGIGQQGLEWLAQVKRETGMKVTTEVANREHVEQALAAGVDVLWVGARTTANPFAVQEVADALRGVDIPVLVKNPVNPDLNLWIGAIERLHKAGLRRIAALHRGFSSLSKSAYRNDPHWQIPIELKRQMRQLPLLCDPSHIAGKREMLFEVIQRAFDLGYDGIMIESHHDPDNAWSDAEQQITPADLVAMMERVVIRGATPQDPAQQHNLDELRAQIDVLDKILVQVLNQRMEVARSIGQFKKRNHMSVLQTSRWDSILGKVLALGREQGLSDSFTTSIFTAIHDESINLQEKVLLGK